MRKEVERLEDDPDAPPDPVDVDALPGDLLALDDDASPVDRLEQVDTAEQRRLAGAGGADQADDVVLGDVQVDAAEHLQLPEGLVHTVEEQRFAHVLDACRRRRSRSTSQSVNRASGIVSATKSSAAVTYDV